MRLIITLAIIFYTTTFVYAQEIKIDVDTIIQKPTFDPSTRILYYDRRGPNKVFITEQGKFYIQKRRRKYIATDKLIKNILGRIK